MGDTWRQQPVIYLFCLLSGQLTAPVRTQPVIYQALVAALSGILKTSLLTVNPSLGLNRQVRDSLLENPGFRFSGG